MVRLCLWICRVFFAAALCPLALVIGQEPAWSVVGLYHFDEGEGALAADSSGADNAGMLGLMPAEDGADPRWVANGKEGGALEFDGANDRVTILHNESLNFIRGIAVEAWVYQMSRTPFARVLDKGPCFDLYIREDGIPTFRFHGAEAHGVRGTNPVPLNQWVHLKASYDGHTMALFVDGKEVASRPYNEPVPNRTNDLRIGAGQNRRGFHGMIDEVKIVNIGYERPSAQAYSPDSETVGLWHFDTAEQAVDDGPNKLHGEIHGALLAPGKIGKALQFDGDDYVRIPYHPSLDLTDELTIDCWVKPTKRTGWARIVEKDSWVYGLWIERSGRADFFYRSASGEGSHTATDQELPLHRWAHLRVEFDGLESAVYLDGEEAIRRDVLPIKDRIATSTGDLFIGNNAAGNRGFVGLIDELRISRAVRTPRPALSMKITPLPSENIWRVAFNARPLREKAASLRWALRDGERKKTFQEAEIRDMRGGLARTTVDVSQLPPGEYLVSAAALDGNGGELAREEKKITKPQKPPWLGANTGVSDEVLPPWTPMTLDQAGDGAVQASCWGRKHSFSGCPFPSQISSAGADLLAGPVRLIVRQGGRELPGTRSSARVTESAGNKVCLEGAVLAGPVEATVKVRMEYDGMIRFDMKLNPSEAAEIESAAIEIPLVGRHAALMHYPGRWFEDPTCAGALPTEGWRRPETWYLWLGDEERGLCWFAEDQAQWGLDPNTPGIEAIPDGETVRLRVYLINSRTTLTEPREFTWGLMATPVKPLPPGWERWRFGSPIGPVTIGVRWSTLQTSRWHSFPVPPDPQAYHAEVKEAHEQGKKFVPYTNFNMQSNTGDEWNYWGEEWNAYAGEGRAADVLAMNVANIRCCAMNPSWCDFITWKYKTFLEEYDSDGFYLDNSSPGRCNNIIHPPDHHRGRHIFAARELMRRIYTVTKQNDPGNVMVCHMSHCLCIPSLSFCDAIVDGEQYGWALKERFDGHYIPITPPDRVRAELMARQWGLAPLFLPCNRGPNPWSPQLMRELLALMLPHGMRFWLAGYPETMVKVLDVVDAFDLPRARFVPYWSAPEWRRMAEEEGLIVSAYVRDGKAMLIVSNLHDQPKELKLKLDLDAIGVGAQTPVASDPLDNLPVLFQDGTLQLSAGGRDLRIVMLCPAEK